MVDFLYFAHLTGLALWLGALVVAAWLVAMAVRAERWEQQVWGLQSASRIGSWLITPSAAVVLFAGIAMIVVGGQLGIQRPLWFKVMEQGGGTIAMLCVGLITWLTIRVRRAVKNDRERAQALRVVRMYGSTLSGLAVAVLGVLLAVSLRV